ncbi:hypothetical protein AMK28_33875 [Streptomyces sp. CB02115]|nr:hypothetical protein AMK28_33875 [Streptomyces sp. CB02115]
MLCGDSVVTDIHGGIWTAYGDEGICGGHPESGGGLAGWNTKGHAVWAPEGRLPGHPLEGCTAATENEQVWLVWYGAVSPSGTYLTRITPATGKVLSYASPVPQPDGFAVRGNRAVFTRRDHNRRTVELIRAERRGTAWTVTSRRRLRVPGRVVLRCGQGRDAISGSVPATPGCASKHEQLWSTARCCCRARAARREPLRAAAAVSAR